MGNTRDLYERLQVLTIKSNFNLHVFKFLLDLLAGALPYFYNQFLEPLEIRHRYENRRGLFRHPLVTCEVERRGIQHQLVKLCHSIDVSYFRNFPKNRAVKYYKSFLLDNQF